ncbi:TPA: hypothetical protein KO341_003601 [Clostridioides difficile]|uniref:hypothetical protein n=2 Tax=Clostridioides difficile TaxID=1496 RepID=UPI001A1ABE22|nr:hypothetical protein [Clostridioides difficile]EGT3729302.1 hypothetical protein [Clostridioides difficile]EGT3734833.1 hypothetical protein [Clostridioides difficile]EGT3885238.1 hypothetical protein [Clostridioides difficile]EGT3975551.1 hypothetical protein [Clostridioides difficile]EGT4264969.1 hypothetical protein [Clostridioides difficile]
MKIWKYNRTVKKRRGVYTELDILAQRYEFEADGKLYRAFFHLYTNKNIDIFRDKDLYKESYMMDYRVGNVTTDIDDVVQQTTTVRFIPDPVIDIVIDNISRGCEINYRIIDNEPSVKFIVTEKLNGTIIETKTNSSDNNYKLKLTDEQIVPLALNSSNSIVIEISTEDGGLVTSKIVTFTRTNNKPTILVNSYSSNSAKFTASDLDNNLSKIEWYLDDVLKETITTDLTAEKTINYELTDNAIHTLKIVATDAENATVEKVLSISKEIMPLQTDASLSDISTKLIEIGEGFKNGKTSIINTLALKNIEASLNNTLVELSEKIKTSFDSSDASVQDLMNQLTQANNTISQLNSKYKYASGTIDVVKNSSLMANLYGESFGRQPGTWLKIDNLGFIPNIFVAECQYVTSNNYFFKHIVIATCNINWFWEKKDFSARIVFTKEKNSNQDFSGSGIIYSNNERDVYINNKGINVPASSPNVSSYLHSWHAIKFI